jgi:hypothetical protein
VVGHAKTRSQVPKVEQQIDEAQTQMNRISPANAGTKRYRGLEIRLNKVQTTFHGLPSA